MRWKLIEVAPQYEVSDTGLVRRVRDMLEVKPFDNGGYDRVKLEGRGQLVHRLVAMAFIPNPNELDTVNHKDRNKRNNHANNLEWMSNGDNVRHSHDDKRIVYLRKTMSDVGKKFGAENGRNSAKAVVQLSKSGDFIAQYISAREAEKATGVGYRLISQVCNGSKKSAHGYLWEFAEGQSTIRKE